MPESIQHKLLRIRPPRVMITYDVETGGAIEMKELPFVVGILADLSGKRDPDAPLPPLKKRKFVEIDRDNFNEVLASFTPRVAFPVANKLQKGENGQDSGEKLNVALSFSHIDDFRPEGIVEQVEALKTLYDARTRLNDLIAKLDGNDDLDKLLQDVAKNTDDQKTLQAETKSTAAEEPAKAEEEKKKK